MVEGQKRKKEALLYKIVVWQILATALTRQTDGFLKNNCHNVVEANR